MSTDVTDKVVTNGLLNQELDTQSKPTTRADEDPCLHTSSSNEHHIPPFTSENNNEPPPPPNGGYGWVVAIAISVINGHTWGLNSSYGVFLAHYLSNSVFPGATALQYAFVGSLSVSCALAVSPLATIGTRVFGTKPTMLFGVVLESLSLILASFATRIWHLFLTQGILFGVGMGFIFTPSVSIVPQWFTTRRSLANGISACGSGLGGVVYAFAAGAMIQNLGLQWAFRILGILAFVVNFACTLVIKDRNKIVGSKQLAFDVKLFKRVEFILLLAFGWFSMLGYIVLIFSLANYARVIGLRPSQAALVTGLHNLAQGLGRPVIGFFSDRTGRLNMATLLTFVTGVFALVIWTNAKTEGVLIFFAFISGLISGVFWAAIGPVTAEVVGLQEVPSALSLTWLVIMLPCTFSQPIAIQLVESSGSYLPTQIWTGLMYVIAAVCLCVVRGWKIIQLEERGCDIVPSRGPGSPPKEMTNEQRHIGKLRMIRNCWKWKKV